MTADAILAYLQAHNTLTLATSDGNVPYACALFYVNDDFTLYFVSDPKTRHAQNIAFNSLVSATINEDYHEWRAIQGVQLMGRCALVTDALQSAKAMALYAAKFPFVKDLVTRPKEIGEAMGKVKFYRITVEWARWIDNAVRLGYKEEIQVNHRGTEHTEQSK
jgi:uncharacterized protein YhbP (UPF0306 family)